MRVLLDECVSEGLRNYLASHDCQTARYAGFAGLENGELLAAAENAKFDVVLTVDRGFEYQQNLDRRKIAIIIILWKVGPAGRPPALGARLPRLHQIDPGRASRQDWRRVRAGWPKANIRRKIAFAFCSPTCYFALRRFQQVQHAWFFEQCSKLSGAGEA